jgi:hypothetical protein
MNELHDWLEYNRRRLLAEMARVRHLLERARGAQPPDDLSPAGALDDDAPTALETLCALFGLSPFEGDVLVMCAGVALDSSFAAALATAQGGAPASPTFALALAALRDPHWSALVPSAPLRRWRLIEVEPGPALTHSPLRVDERVLHHLVGLDYLDERLNGLVRPVEQTSALAPSQAATAARLAGLLSAAPPLALVQLCGDDPDAQRTLAAQACASLGVDLYVMRAADIPASPAERAAFACLWEREAFLAGRTLLIDCDDANDAAVALVAEIRTPLVLSSQGPLRLRERAAVRMDVRRPSSGEQRGLWRDSLGIRAEQLNGQVDALVGQYNFSAQEIVTVVREAAGDGSWEFGIDELWDMCRDQARPRLDDLAQRITPAAAWEDLVLPQVPLATLLEIAVHVRHRVTVQDNWGFAAKSARGQGISALFTGPSGTGKTMAAEVLANELRLDLYRIDLSQVVSKYIGETEKNLRRVFDAAESGGAILLFDEADALFGKRSEVKDSHDRYANIEVSYLLQRMEAYRGLAILTTNMKSALDPAFLRRIRFVTDFPFPDMAQRAEIWRRIFPAATPTRELDVARLARLNVAGGNIHNIALHAAFHAANAGEPVQMSHLLWAARAEYAKLEKPLSEAEIGGWI